MTDSNSSQFWDDLYKSGQFPWDLGGPTPLFKRMAEQEDLKPGEMLVLGAGHGHDARLFARYGFEVTAVDFSSEAVAEMRRMNDPGSLLEIVQLDFFSVPAEWNGGFDYVLDYTSFCAITPKRRGEYADMVARLLKKQGKYITLAFPIGSRPGGPPYTVQPDDIVHLFENRGFRLSHREIPFDSVYYRAGYEELLILDKE